MKRAWGFLAAAIAMSASWYGIMWALIFVGHVVFPDSIHNVTALSGILVIAPLCGIYIGFRAYRALRLA